MSSRFCLNFAVLSLSLFLVWILFGRKAASQRQPQSQLTMNEQNKRHSGQRPRPPPKEKPINFQPYAQLHIFAPPENVEAPEHDIILTQPTNANLASYRVKYLNAENQIVTECLRESMADQIPHERIFPSTLEQQLPHELENSKINNTEAELYKDNNWNPKYAHFCPTEESRPFSLWPF